ncbi:MAG: HEAT repeat domain-containing protein [Clostridia bacterium]|nr:HEAT repeat domain-containing protein [Deltaproteobacteria bacterium]
MVVDFDAASLEQLEALLLGDDAALRADAATALGDRLRTLELAELPLSIRELLAALLDDQTPMVRFEAAMTLAEANDKRATSLLLSAAATRRFRLDAVRALGTMGDKRAVPALRAMISRFLMPWADKMQAAAALCALGDTQGAEYLVEKLTSRRDAERASAVHFIGESRHPEARRLLEPMVDDAKHPMRDVAARALGFLGDPASAPVLKAARIDADEALRCDIDQALARLTAAIARDERNL